MFTFALSITKKQTIMKLLKFKAIFSTNEVNENYSVMAAPSEMVIELNESKTQTYNEIKDYAGKSILDIWANAIWQMRYPNTKATLIKVEILN